MNFNRDQMSPVSIRRFERGSVTIGQDVVTTNVAIFRDAIRRDIAIPDVGELHEDDLSAILEDTPEIVVLGTGWSARRPPRELVFAMARRGIGFEIMDTPAACRTFNILLSEGRDAAAVLFVGD